MQLADLESKTLQELQAMAKEVAIENYTKFRKRELIFELLKVLAVKEGLIFSQGILEILPDGFGFL
jgi:transcription termination factor Rho